MQLRENPIIDAEEVAWTTLQRIQMVVREKKALSLNTNLKVANHFKSIKFAKSSEVFNTSFVEAACAIEKMLAHAETLQVITFWDNKAGINGPFNSAYKLQALGERAKTTENIAWALAALSDSLQMGTLHPGSITFAALKTGGLAMLQLLKRGILHHLLYKFMDSHPFSTKAKDICRQRLASHKEVRLWITALPEDKKGVDMSWAATESKSTMRFLHFVEALVYSDCYDTTLKVGVKSSKSADIVITYPSISEDFRQTSKM